MNRKKLLIVLAVVFQIGVVASMVASREWLLATGKSYVFQTAPIDPRDIFRGDYVRLNYLFNSVPVSQLDEAILSKGLRKGEKVFLSLTTNSGGISSGGQLHAAPPQGPYLKGYVTSHWPNYYLDRQNEDAMRKAVQNAWPVTVKYGIEQYYVQQDSGKEMEKLRGRRNDFQVPLLIYAAVSESGEAGIRSYEWANIALKTEIAHSPERDAPDEKASAVMQLTLKNRGNSALNLPLKADNCSFALVADGRRAPQDALNFASPRDCAGKAVKMVPLPPGESYVVTFDLNQPNWWVIYKDKLTPPGKLPWEYRYRIEYQGEQIDGLNAAIVSSAFHGRGNVD
jgi:uncharacterized membrane-anchored protein